MQPNRKTKYKYMNVFYQYMRTIILSPVMVLTIFLLFQFPILFFLSFQFVCCMDCMKQINWKQKTRWTYVNMLQWSLCKIRFEYHKWWHQHRFGVNENQKKGKYRYSLQNWIISILFKYFCIDCTFFYPVNVADFKSGVEWRVYIQSKSKWT